MKLKQSILWAQGNGELPHEKGPLSPRFRGEHALRRYQMEKSAVLPVNYARRSAPLSDHN